ncbi:MAG: hypothetical protein L0216_21580 [Planctomycetales bacterium]|nr:hypothetical protein [Planctomycetales bacterium]
MAAVRERAVEPATLIGPSGTFRLEILGWAYPTRQQRWDDWLLGRAEWNGSLGRIEFEGTMLLAGELRCFAEGLALFLTEPGTHAWETDFVEPYVAMALRSTADPEKFRARLDIRGEPVLSGEHLDVESELEAASLRKFAVALRRISEAFPPRK